MQAWEDSIAVTNLTLMWREGLALGDVGIFCSICMQVVTGTVCLEQHTSAICKYGCATARLCVEKGIDEAVERGWRALDVAAARHVRVQTIETSALPGILELFV